MKYVSDLTEATDFSVTELRVHGVGGSTPEALVGVPHVNRVAGTPRAGFYRSPAWITLDGPKRNLEGYSWGGMTSSSVFRALWIILLPFALINLVGWMFPHAGRATSPDPRRPRDAIVAGLFRLLALLSSLAVVTFVASITIEMVGVRCGTDRTCGGAWYLLPWQWWAGRDLSGGIAVGAVLAVGFVLALAFVARMGQARKGQVDLTLTLDPAYQTNLVGGQTAQPMEMWNRPDVAERLGLAHTSASIILVGLLAVEAVRSTTGRWLAGPLVALVLLAAVVVLFVWKLDLAGAGRQRSLLGLVVAAFVWTILDIGSVHGGSMSGPVLPFVPIVIFGGFAVTFLATGLWAVFARSDDDAGKKPDRIFLLYPALLLIVAVWGGVLGVAVDVLGVGFDLTVTNRFALVGLGWLVGAVVSIAWFWARQPKRTIAEILESYDIGSDDPRDLGFLKRIRSAEAAAALTDRIGGILIGGFVGSLPFLVAVVATLLSGSDDSWTSPYEGFAGRAVVVLPAIGVALIGWMIRDPSARRGFGIIWDVSTFWPRWFHPWAPPAYGEFAVPHLHLRINGLVAANERVILSTHSQGSVLGAAVLAVLEPATAARVRWITHGCPLHRLYAAYFPEYFDVELFESIRSKLATSEVAPAWTNLWRRTDYIGGRVLEAVDVLVVDPEAAETVLDLDPRPRPARHSNFYVTEAYGTRLTQFVEAFGSPGQTAL
jgi:hypothetical protein